MADTNKTRSARRYVELGDDDADDDADADGALDGAARAAMRAARAELDAPLRFRTRCVVDAAANAGNKPLRGHGRARLERFAEWAFARRERVVIVGGHSPWMRAFFREYLPRSFEHLSKQLKVANGGVVGFDLMRAQVPAYSASGHASGMRTIYRIEPTSITEVYKGFAKSAPKAKAGKSKTV